MSLYGDRYISCAALKRWVKTLDVTPFTFVDVGGRTIELIPAHKDAIRAQLDLFSQSVDALNDGDDWRSLQGILSSLFYNMFFRVDNNAVRVANYYECLIIPSNIKTYKKSSVDSTVKTLVQFTSTTEIRLLQQLERKAT